jgi:hypothetical protein
MKLTKRQLHKIIREEKEKLLNELSPADRASGLYFELDKRQDAFHALSVLFDGAVADAIEDGVMDEEAVSAVAAGVRQLFEKWITKKTA